MASFATNTLEETAIKGRVLSASSNKYTVDLGNEKVVINARKKIKYRSEEILTGDFVEVIDDAISKVYPRTSRFIRPNIANIDSICEEMYFNCSSLQTIKVHFNSWSESSNSTYNWVYGVNNNGAFYCSANLIEQHDVNHIPNGWNIIRY